MRNQVQRIVLVGLGIVMLLGFWTAKGLLLEEANATSAHIPAKVWGGGGGTIVIEAETSEPAHVAATFATEGPAGAPKHRYLETWQRIVPGRHTFTVDVPPNVAGIVEVAADEPKAGSRVRVAVQVGGRTVAEDSQTLGQPMGSNDAAFAHVHLADYATGTPGKD